MIDMQDGPDPELAGHWRVLPIWQRWALIHVADGITLKTWMDDDDGSICRSFNIGAKRESDSDTWRSVIHTRVLEDTHDVGYVIITALRSMRDDFLLHEAERDAAALRRIRAMASSIVPNETPASATYAWVKS